MASAFDQLRRYARGSNQKLSDVARRLVERNLDPDLVLQRLTPPRPVDRVRRARRTPDSTYSETETAVRLCMWLPTDGLARVAGHGDT
jgi:hypothetical protein